MKLSQAHSIDKKSISPEEDFLHTTARPPSRLHTTVNPHYAGPILSTSEDYRSTTVSLAASEDTEQIPPSSITTVPDVPQLTTEEAVITSIDDISEDEGYRDVAQSRQGVIGEDSGFTPDDIAPRDRHQSDADHHLGKPKDGPSRVLHGRSGGYVDEYLSMLEELVSPAMIRFRVGEIFDLPAEP